MPSATLFSRATRSRQGLALHAGNAALAAAMALQRRVAAALLERAEQDPRIDGALSSNSAAARLGPPIMSG
jgi:hypothetical protein